MKKAIFFSVVFSFLLNTVSAENILILTNPRSKETNIFRKGSYLVFELKTDRSSHEGFIRDITDSSLVFDNSQVSLSQIDILAGRTKSSIVAGKVANTAGYTFLLAGACVTGLWWWYPIDWAWSLPAHGVRVRNYSNWNASIMVETQQANPQKQVLHQNDITQPVPEAPKKEKKKKGNVKAGDDVYGN